MTTNSPLQSDALNDIMWRAGAEAAQIDRVENGAMPLTGVSALFANATAAGQSVDLPSGLFAAEACSRPEVLLSGLATVPDSIRATRPEGPSDSQSARSTREPGPAPHAPLAGHPGLASLASQATTMTDLLCLLDASDAVTGESVDLPVPVRRLQAGDTLFHEGARVESIFFVRSGSFKLFHTEQDGYEQVLGFVARTEMLGFDALCLQRHSTEAVALEDATVFVMLVRDLFALCERCPGFGRLLHLCMSTALTRHGELANMMAAVSSEVRLARFLLQLSRRMVVAGQSPRRLLLRMSRRDIASHLGVAHETISRSFKVMAQSGLLAVDNREVEVLDLAKLELFAQGTRRQVDDIVRPRGAGSGPGPVGLQSLWQAL